jgi:dTDP-glucose 4,6-dehydratase
MNLLVCGGAGFIGSNFVRYMLETYPTYKIVNYDKLTYAGNIANLADVADNPNYAFEQGDIVDINRIKEVVAKYEIDHIINFAAETHVDRSIHGGATEFIMTNVLGVQMLLDTVKDSDGAIKRFVNVSTDEVFGDLELDDERKFDENWPIMPNMPYAAAKAGGDLMCNAYRRTHKVPVIVTHCSNNYGPYQFPEKLIPFFTFKLLAGETVPVYGDGQNVRDWIHVVDHARALDLILHKGEDGEVYNIGSDNELSNMELTKRILAIMGKDESSIEYVRDRPGHDRKYAIDSTKIEALGWQPLYPAEKFDEGLRETVQWYQDNTEWVSQVRSKKEDEMNVFQKDFFKK